MSNQVDSSEELISPGCGLWLSWMFLTLSGTALGWVLAWQVSFRVPASWSIPVLGATVGLVLGAAQWLALRGRLALAGWWVPATSLGWGAGFYSGVELAHRFGLVEAGLGVAVGLAIGLFLGLFQWLILRRQVQRSIWWLPANTLAWASALLYYEPNISAVGLLYGALAGLITGTVLLWLLYRPAVS